MLQFHSIVKNRRPLRRIFVGAIGFCLILLLGLFPTPGKAQINLAIVQEIIDGPEVFIEEDQAEVEDEANFGQVVHTAKSRAGLMFNNGAAGRIGTNARVTVGQCVEVKQGQVLVSGPVDGCIAGFSVGVQGTLYIMETEDGEMGDIKVLEGTVEVESDDGTTEPVELTEGEKVSVLGELLGPIEEITAEEFVAIVRGELFSGFQVPVTPEGAIFAICSRLFPGFNCSASLPTPPIPTPPIPGPSIPGSPF